MDMDHCDSQGRTPLYLAFDRGHIKIVELLLEHGANVNMATGSGWTPFHFACFKTSTRLVEKLLERKAETSS